MEPYTHDEIRKIRRSDARRRMWKWPTMHWSGSPALSWNESAICHPYDITASFAAEKRKIAKVLRC
ncbi:hypothetical protein ACHAXR_005003 [Thalassiosira sp. AJA248-18]